MYFFFFQALLPLPFCIFLFLFGSIVCYLRKSQASIFLSLPRLLFTLQALGHDSQTDCRYYWCRVRVFNNCFASCKSCLQGRVADPIDLVAYAPLCSSRNSLVLQHKSLKLQMILAGPGITTSIPTVRATFRHTCTPLALS